MYRFHEGCLGTINAVVVQLWVPGSEVVFYENSDKDSFEVNEGVSRECGLLATEISSNRSKLFPKKVHLKGGGLYVSRYHHCCRS